MIKLCLFFSLVFLSSCSPDNPEKTASNYDRLTDVSKNSKVYKRNSIDELLKEKIKDYLGKPVLLGKYLTHKSGSWSIVCGSPLEIDGSQLDYSSTELRVDAEEGLVDDYYCALFEYSSGTPKLREISIGSTDMPMLDWVESYGLSEDIIDFSEMQ